MSKQLFEINSEQELKDVLSKNNEKLFVNFTSPVCPPCIMLEPVMEELVEKGICSVAKINVLQNSNLANSYNIQATPTTIIFDKQEIKKVILGYQPAEAWAEILEKI